MYSFDARTSRQFSHRCGLTLQSRIDTLRSVSHITGPPNIYAQPSYGAPPNSGYCKFRTVPQRADRWKTGLLVLNSISFPFQSHPDLPPSRKTALLGIIRQTLLQACVSNNLTVCERGFPVRVGHLRVHQIVVTSQMATKMLSADGSAATFDTGARAVMMPQLGSYLLIDADCGLKQPQDLTTYLLDDHIVS